MNTDAIDDELLSPAGLRDSLLRCGLVRVEITIEEFFLTEAFGSTYPKLSTYDRIALAIAKERNILLMTGDKSLRHAAKKEGVKIIGTLGILDKLFYSNLIERSEYQVCLLELEKLNGRKVRLPADEIAERLKALRNDTI